MVKKSLLLVVLMVFILSASGCTLAKGTVGFAQGAQEGFKEDLKVVSTADAWLKKNLW